MHHEYWQVDGVLKPLCTEISPSGIIFSRNWLHYEALQLKKTWCESWRPSSARYVGKPQNIFKVTVIGNKCVLYYLSIHCVSAPEIISIPHPAFVGSATAGLCMLLGIRNLDVWMDMQVNIFSADGYSVMRPSSMYAEGSIQITWSSKEQKTQHFLKGFEDKSKSELKSYVNHHLTISGMSIPLIFRWWCISDPNVDSILEKLTLPKLKAWFVVHFYMPLSNHNHFFRKKKKYVCRITTKEVPH